MNPGRKDLIVNLSIRGIGILLGCLSGVAVSRIPGVPPGVAYVAGLNVVAIAALYELIYRIPLNTQKHEDSLALLAGALADKSKSQSLVLLALSRAGKKIEKDETEDIWRGLMWNTDESYAATNYIDPEFYNSNQVQSILKLQKGMLRAGDQSFTIHKLFIWKDEESRKSKPARDTVRLHKDDEQANMILREIFYDKLVNDDTLACCIKKVDGMIDFAIFDKRVVFVWFLDDRQLITGGWVFVGEDEVAKFQSVFTKLFQAGTPLKK
jgi:hypothetical protein